MIKIKNTISKDTNSKKNASKNETSQSSNSARAIIINVDDLGLSSAVNDAVIQLAERGRIGASSYMAGGQITAADMRTLADLNVDIGLHLDLTGIFPSALQGSLKSIMITSYLRRLNPTQVTDVINRQLDGFEDTFGHAPVFIDGHQHIHQFPIIRQSLIKELNARYSDGSNNPICARVTTPLVDDLKSWIIYGLGGRAWRKLCAENNIATNHYFGGVYDFDANFQQLAALWESWLTNAPRTNHLSPAMHSLPLSIESLGTYAQYGSTTPAIHSVPNALPSNLSPTLIMCHPAVPASHWQDDIKAAREREFEWLMSRQFEQLLHQYEVRLVRWSDIVAS
ncbi:MULTISPECIES: ChbG/HpnK family deacetylase [Psychrobacter]|uniref:ChbG/HpnK family deacetylase n=1 Tax=Psychrobacter TaxID=497 RepID=UPI00191B8459|nr:MULTISPECIES: ChbG/HpnK family deacetylase [Psychrobacter]